jgi:hypothetical protein
MFRRELASTNTGGTEIFEAETLDELCDKLAEAKRNATLKIRELSAQIKQMKAMLERGVAQEREDLQYLLKENPQLAIEEITRRQAQLAEDLRHSFLFK